MCIRDRYNTKVTQGRGFSLAEIKGAGLGIQFARSIGIAVDHRRINKSQESLDLNIKRLKEYISKLVLFPKIQKKQKKGLVNDTPAADLEKVVQQQNTESQLMGLKPFNLKKREKAVKITKEMAANKAYQTIRTERMVQKHNGKKNKKVQE
eukprot:TRINITY_DN214_c0_g1_i7.p2 TRINITY_DN214_c0_g1~~TRINITY_DN214_c0_g1_i7.p2  ORF type:complete len:161 (-),score=66.23 TRINITY_DN214_c0_g1_i7:196-648(-)